MGLGGDELEQLQQLLAPDRAALGVRVPIVPVGWPSTRLG